MGQWLKACRADTVAMQATGVYWVAMYQILEEEYGLKVQVVNARHAKTLPGRKSDVQECQWLHMSPWKTEKQFASWLGLCPDNRKSGGKISKRGTRKVINRAATALWLAPQSRLRVPGRSEQSASFLTTKADSSSA